MLINPQTRQKVKEAIQSGSVNTLFTPPTNRNLNQTKTVVIPSSVIPTSFGNVAPLIGSDGKIEFTLQEGLKEARLQGKTLVTLLDSDDYVLKNGGYHWTGDLIFYPKPGEKFGKEIRYKDGNDKQQYLIKVPQAFKDLTGDFLVKCIDGKHSDGKPFYEYNYDNASKLWVVQLNHEDLLISSNLMHPANIHRKNDYYIVDSELIPNGAKVDSGNQAARYFWQDGSGTYLGLFRRGGDDGRQIVGAFGWPSGSHGVLVYV